MPDLSFAVEGAAPVAFAVAPMLAFQLRIRSAVPGERIDAVALRCQIRLDVTRRRYQPAEQARLLDLFGEPSRWNQTLRSLLWTHVSTIVPAFAGETSVELQVPCSYDFTLAATKYFYALEDGAVPLTFLFSGTVFHRGEHGGLQAVPISWDQEASFGLPVPTWRTLMDEYYPGSAWLCLSQDMFDRLYQYKTERGLPTWEHAIEALLVAAQQPAAQIPPQQIARGGPIP